jgi:hypothetical protein
LLQILYIRVAIYCYRFYISEWLFIVTDFIYQSGYLLLQLLYIRVAIYCYRLQIIKKKLDSNDKITAKYVSLANDYSKQIANIQKHI